MYKLLGFQIKHSCDTDQFENESRRWRVINREF